jgi:tRNA(fMet)-specific endonuclease VapC
VPKALLDTTAYVDLQRARKHLREPWAANTLRRSNAYTQQHGKPCLSTLSVIEITLGFEEELAHEKRLVFREKIAPAFEILQLDFDTASLTGEIYGKLERKRQRIGVTDTGLAATAIQHGLILITANFKHFERVADLGYPLRIENWRNA